MSHLYELHQSGQMPESPPQKKPKNKALRVILSIAFILVASFGTKAVLNAWDPLGKNDGKEQVEALNSLIAESKLIEQNITSRSEQFTNELTSFTASSGGGIDAQQLPILKTISTPYCTDMRNLLAQYSGLLDDKAWPSETTKSRTGLKKLYSNFSSYLKPCSQGEKTMKFFKTFDKKILNLAAQEVKLTSQLQSDLALWAEKCGCAYTPVP